MFDILQILKYDTVMEELENINIQKEIKEERGTKCLWEEEDDDGNELLCPYSVCINQDGTVPDYCPYHMEEYNTWMELLDYYIKDVLKMIEPVLIKKLNKEQTGWKTFIEDELGMTKYLVKKFILEKHEEGVDVKDIAILLDGFTD